MANLYFFGACTHGPASLASTSFRVVARFFIARVASAEVMAEVARENQIFGDIVFLDYEDTYRGVGHKTINMCIFASKIKYDDHLIYRPRR
jgi:hypothetical protein